MLIQRYDYTPISRQSVDGKRHYCLPDGSKVPSVTTILDRTKSEEKKEALANWRKRVGEVKAQEITTEAANRGTRMHKWLEDYVRNNRTIGEPGTNPYSAQSHVMAKTVINEGLIHAEEIWGIEVPLYVSGLYAGTTDACGIYKGQPTILDYKQTNKPKKTEWIDDYFLQLCAYGLAHNETYGTDIKQGVVLMCVQPTLLEDGTWSKPQFQTWEIKDKEWDFWHDKWLERVEQYYRLS